MKIERVVFVLVLVGLVFVAIIALFVYKTSVPAPETEYVETATTTDPAQENPSESSNNLPPQTDQHNALDDCIELKANEAIGKEYERGSLLVTFHDLVSFSTAIESLELLGLSAIESSTARSNFDRYNWLSVSVPSGEEFKWQCLLDASEGVKGASLNIIFKLRQ